MKTIALTLLAVFVTTLSIPAAETRGTTPDLKPEQLSTNQVSYLQQLKVLIDKLAAQGKDATDKGKEVTKETGNWLKSDFQKIGDWEYKQLTLNLSELATLEKHLNELGSDRWNCFWVHQQGQSLHLLLKRPAVSYLHKLSLIDFMRMIPTGSGSE